MFCIKQTSLSLFPPFLPSITAMYISPSLFLTCTLPSVLLFWLCSLYVLIFWPCCIYSSHRFILYVHRSFACFLSLLSSFIFHIKLLHLPTFTLLSSLKSVPLSLFFHSSLSLSSHLFFSPPGLLRVWQATSLLALSLSSLSPLPFLLSE